ncbi:MAG: hypothetical protein OEZ68_05855 [Gammaproteobacteria bacterium]|nr:hypothetical protein [Gammaproteobacteria bacterium]MDH5800312.1 hypothetical protein [Gammaproteobacteria bacterium]
MKQTVETLLKNDLFILLLNGVIVYTAFTAVILATLQVPPEAILDSGLKEILMIFEGD